MSKSELRRKCVVNPLDMADRLHEFEQENEKLKADLAMLRVASIAVVDRWDTPLWKDVAPTADFIGRLRTALSATASSDAWLNEQKAKVLEGAANRMMETYPTGFVSPDRMPMFCTAEDCADELRRMAAELRNSESGTGQPSRTA